MQGFDTFLVSEAIPNSVASQYDELVTWVASILGNIWEGSHSLILGVKMIFVFVLEVSKCSAQSKVSINSRVFDIVLCFLDSLQFIRIIWLMIETELDSLVISAEDASAITSICTIDFLVGDENYTGRGSSVVSIFCLLLYFIVKLKEGFLKCIFVLLLLKFGLAFENSLELLSSILSNLFASMAVKHAEKHAHLFIAELYLNGDVRIFHATPPSLHGANTPFTHIRATIFGILIFHRRI